MRKVVRNALELCSAAVANLVRITLDVSLLSIFILHFQRTLAVPRYAPVYPPSSRQNEVRCQTGFARRADAAASSR